MTVPLWQSFDQWHLVGIKGVAMTALAQCLAAAGKRVTGVDVSEDFVTKEALDQLSVPIGTDFLAPLPPDTDVVVYTAAHQGKFNPQVVRANEQEIPTASHAEALSWMFNQKEGIAVCGVGGKSTTSAMIAWILEKTAHTPSYAIGVGGIPGLLGTGAWRETSQVFVAEADEYVIDSTAPSRGEPITPRFSFLRPQTIVCTNLEFDHPDVYRDFAHTLEVFGTFFETVPADGQIIMNVSHRKAAEEIRAIHQLKVQYTYFGDDATADARLIGDVVANAGMTETDILVLGQPATLRLQLPGRFNLLNALAAVLAVQKYGVTVAAAVEALTSFRSTKRRAEYIGHYRGAKLYDDYAHHPHEVRAIIHAYREWFPESRLMVAFQSHTFSRTKALFADFVTAFDEADEVAMIDIFPSAREALDPTVTSDLLCDSINTHAGAHKATNYHTLPTLREILVTKLEKGMVCLTVGAGDIYHVYDGLKLD